MSFKFLLITVTISVRLASAFRPTNGARHFKIPPRSVSRFELEAAKEGREDVILATVGLEASEVSAFANLLPNAIAHDLGPEALDIGVHGFVGRAILISGRTQNDELDLLERALAEAQDNLVIEGELSSPALICVLEHGSSSNEVNRDQMVDAVLSQLDQFSLLDEIAPLPTLPDLENPSQPDVPWFRQPANWERRGTEEPLSLPTVVLRIDGEVTASGDLDASSVAVFDGLVSEELRAELLSLFSSDGHDPNSGPDPACWVRGGLSDVVGLEDISSGFSGDGLDILFSASSAGSVGLCPEAVDFLCANPPFSGAISAFEDIIKKRIFPNHIVSRMPPAVFGDSVSALTANAPRHGESFTWHIDADPKHLPPSPWTDAFGTYRNRSPGELCLSKSTLKYAG